MPRPARGSLRATWSLGPSLTGTAVGHLHLLLLAHLPPLYRSGHIVPPSIVRQEIFDGSVLRICPPLAGPVGLALAHGGLLPPLTRFSGALSTNTRAHAYCRTCPGKSVTQSPYSSTHTLPSRSPRQGPRNKTGPELH